MRDDIREVVGFGVGIFLLVVLVIIGVATYQRMYELQPVDDCTTEYVQHQEAARYYNATASTRTRAEQNRIMDDLGPIPECP